jgi:prepilin-type N-terminal cleavage/methylation domain-containing protein
MRGESFAMKRSSGFTMVEVMIVIVVAAIGIALAVPSFNDMIERKRLGGAADAAFEHLQRAKSQALKRSKPILVDFNVNGTDWAIGFTDKMGGCDAEDVSGTDACDVDEDNDLAGTTRLVMRVSGGDFSDITMSQAVGFANATVAPGGCTTVSNAQGCFDFLRGLARTGQYDFASANYKLRLQVTMLGHINLCIPSGEKKMPGYNGC